MDWPNVFRFGVAVSAAAIVLTCLVVSTILELRDHTTPAFISNTASAALGALLASLTPMAPAKSADAPK